MQDAASPRQVSEPSDSECRLCDLPVPADPITDPEVDGEFCCRGCLEVQRTLGDVDVDDVDELRGEDADDPDDIEGEELYLAVDGMHCSTCEVFLENRASGIEGVAAARASYATDTVQVTYDADTTDPEGIPDAISGMGYEARPRAEDTNGTTESAALVKFLLGGGLFGMMVMLWYVLFLYPTYFGFDPVVELGGFDGLYIYANIWLLTSLILFYTGYPILRGALVSLRARQPNMDLLVALAAIGAYAYSTIAMLAGRSDLYFDVTVAVVLVVTAGNYYEGRIKERAAGLLSELTQLQVEDARLNESGERVPLDTVDAGEELLVRPGERVPLDGTVLDGSAAVDEALITGESVPVEKGPGDPVLGGTVVTDQPLVVEVGEEAASTLDRIVELLWSIQSTRPGVQRLADRLAIVFVPLVILLSSVTALWLLATGSAFTPAMLTALTVLIVSCPCALGLATPLAVASGVQTAAKRGIVIAAETIFEDAPDVDIVAFDKTGTLTTAEMTVERVDADDTEAVLARAAALERLTEHPVARAIVNHVNERAPDTLPSVDNFQRHARGVTGRLDGDQIIVGHPLLFAERDWEIPDRFESTVAEARDSGTVPIVVGWNGRAEGVVVVGDTPRPNWEDVLSRVGEERRVVVITGDEGAAAERFRAAPAVDDVFAGVPPEAKAETVKRLRTQGKTAMVGDGSNDAPALAAADVGIALGNGTELATDAADAVIASGNLDGVPDVFDLSARTNRRIRQNLGWAFVYNAIAIPLAITGYLNPLLAAAAMALSSFLVVLNSSRSL
ncbi:heavy metal translocating P-type ATPase [Natranaeroarchaeum aerophilus]|uniref:Cation-translocating P-type ATPase n=1 Tax=Natranaeroarchaeum aerophilus TaxID=2917711 RepID=A0AAE3K507_9EURY|nr:cation-translocating P-type ATPase [Natranaeroarchaeum aerophilus]MCL9813070.1 cation-translocating P-type ATPase [Natranaeroarchaeum aerophilus]